MHKKIISSLLSFIVFLSVFMTGCAGRNDAPLEPYRETESVSLSVSTEDVAAAPREYTESASAYENIIITGVEYDGIAVDTYAFPGVIHSDDGRYIESMSNGVTIRSEIYKASPEFTLSKKKDELLSVINETADSGSVAENQLDTYVFSYDYIVTIGDTTYPCRTFFRMDAIGDSASLVTSITVDTSSMTEKTESVARDILSATGFA